MPLYNRISFFLLCWVLLLFSYVPASHASEIEGYLSSFSVTQGESIDIHASTSDASFFIEIYKDTINDYQLISTTPPISGNHNHATPAENAWLGPDWPVAYTLNIPSNWESGLYLIKLKTNDSFTKLMVVVKEDDYGSTSNILVLDSAPTRIAYDNWGGKSFYQSTIEGDPKTADFVSLKRPGQNFPRLELPQLSRWLQFQNIPAEWASMFDLHYDSTLLDNYNVVVLIGHNEYWSREMRDNYDSFVARGGNAVILSGNTMWWQVRIEGDLLICYKSDNYQDDPMYGVDNSRVTSYWFSSPVNEPENTSTGVSWRNGGYVNHNGILTEEEGYGGYTVVNSDHWIYDGTNLQDNDIFGQERTIVGHETDGAILDWTTGKPVVTGSDGTPLNFTLLGYSEAFNGWHPEDIGFATMGIFQGQNDGGYVFNAATIDWANGLWDLTPNTIADNIVSQITYNVINEFSILSQPLTIKTTFLPDNIIGTFYSTFVRIIGGSPGYTWTLSNGSLSAGLTLNSATGEISGTPIEIGSSTFDVTVTDDLGASISATFTMSVDEKLVYEDAEDGNTLGWRIYAGDSSLASISNMFDTDRSSQVIVLSGSGQDHGYDFREPKWENSEQFVLQWSMQLSESYTFYVDVETTDGHKYMTYKPDDYDNLGTGEYIHHGLGTSSINGQWQTFTRDLQADLLEAQPGVVLLKVNGILIRGSGRLDDVALLNEASAGPLAVETTWLPGGLLSETYSTFIQVSGGEAPYSWTISNGSLPTGLTLNSETGEISGTPDAIDRSTFEVTVTDESQGSISATFTVEVLEAVNGLVYEDAEDGNTLGWGVYDPTPAGADISNEFDADRGNQVIVLSGSGTGNGYRLRNADGNQWQNSEQFILQWSMKFSESYAIYIDVQTTAGHKYMTYKPDDYDNLGTGEYIHHGLGTSSINGQWQTFTRDLQADLEEAQPGVVLLEVNGFLIRGSGRLDDIKLLNAASAGPLVIETTWLPRGLLSVPYSAFIQVSGGEAGYIWVISNDSLPAGLSLNSETGEISGTPIETGSSTFDVTVTDGSAGSISATFTVEVLEAVNGLIYEDAEDGNTLGWRIYDPTPAGADISNEFDADRGNQVIVLSGSGMSNGYRLRNADGSKWQNSEQFILQWSMKFSESYAIYVDVETTAGHKYLTYKPDDYDDLGAGEYIHHGLGASSINGQWQTFTRDLQADLEEAQPGIVLLEVNGFLIRGSGRLDDMALLNSGALAVETTWLPGGLLSETYSAFIQISGGEAPYSWTLSNGSLPTGLTLNSATGEISGTPDALGSSTFDVTVTDSSGGSASATFTVEVLEVVNGLIYEDAEDGNTLGWRIYDPAPAGADISNEFDADRGNQVIVLSGSGTSNGYRLRNADGSKWQNSEQFIVEWSMKFSESYTIYVDVETTAGHKYLSYKPRDEDDLGTGEYIYHGLGTSSINGQWQTFTRDLQADLEEAQPGVILLEVNGFLIRGSGRLDDVKLL